MKVKLIISIVFALVVNVFANSSGMVTIEGQNRHWHLIFSQRTPEESKLYCESIGYTLVNVAEGLAILNAAQISNGNQILKQAGGQTVGFWTKEKGFTLDAAPFSKKFPLFYYYIPGIFNKVVVVTQLTNWPNAMVGDFTNQPNANPTLFNPLCISNIQ